MFYISFKLVPEYSGLALILKRALLSRSVEAQASIFRKFLNLTYA